MTNEIYQCWLGAGLSKPLLEARLVKMTDNEAIVCMKCPDLPPPVCNLLFSPSANIGRRCRVISQVGNVVQLAIHGRTEPDTTPSEVAIVPI